MKNFRNYQILKLSHQITLLVYKCSQDFPWEETNGITYQLRFTALSITKGMSEKLSGDLNIGYEFSPNNAISSINRLRYLLMLAFHLNYLKKEDRKNILKKVYELKRKLNSIYNQKEIS